MNDIEKVKLNFRGEIIYVLKDTINIKDSYFNLIFENNKLKDEEIFLDRDIVYFKQILNYLIYDEIYVTKENFRHILQDFKFYNFYFDDKHFLHINEYTEIKKKMHYHNIFNSIIDNKIKIEIKDYKFKEICEKDIFCNDNVSNEKDTILLYDEICHLIKNYDNNKQIIECIFKQIQDHIKKKYNVILNKNDTNIYYYHNSNKGFGYQSLLINYSMKDPSSIYINIYYEI